MKVLMTSDNLGGVWTYALELCRGLRTYDVEVILAVAGRPLTNQQKQATEELGNVRCFESPYRLEWMDRPWREVDAAGEWLLRLCDHVRPDVVHLNDYSHGALTWDRPALIVAHSCVCSWMRHVRGEKAGPSWNEYRRRVQRGLRGVDAIVAPTQNMLDDIEREYGEFSYATVVHNGIHARPTRRIVREPFVLTAGRLWDEAKNVKLLATVADSIRWPIHVAGDLYHPDHGRTEQFRHLRVLGQLSPSQMHQAMSRASLYALPAKYEPFGLTALEAALTGCPLLLSDIGTLRELWDGAAYFASTESPTEWRDAIGQLMLDDSAREHLGQLARSRAMLYGSSKMAREYFRLYQQLQVCYPRRLQVDGGVLV